MEHNVTGLVYDHTNPDALRLALLDLAKRRRADLRTMGDAARRRAAVRFTPSRSTAAYLDLARLLAGGGRA